MKATAATPALCPVCNVRSLVQHCEGSATCGWHKCRNKECEAILDLAKRRGYAPDGKGFRQVNLA